MISKAEEERIRENVREVDRVRRLTEVDVDLRGFSIVDFERTQGWITVRIVAPSFPDPLSLLVELPSGYPTREPPKFFFTRNTGNKALENLTQVVRDMAIVYQRDPRTGGRCLEDCLVFTARALSNIQQHPTPSLSASSSHVPLVLSASQLSLGGEPIGMSFLTPAGGSVLLSNSGLFTTGSLSDLSESYSSNTVAFNQSNSPNKMSPVSSRIIPPIALEDSAEIMSLYGSPRNYAREPSDRKSNGGSNRAERDQRKDDRVGSRAAPSSFSALPSSSSAKWRPRCGASFSGNDLLVVFSSRAYQSSNDGSSSSPVANPKQSEHSWDTDDDNDIDDSSEQSGSDYKKGRSGKDLFRLVILDPPFQVRTAVYQLESPNNASRSPTSLARLAWQLLETGSDDVLSASTMKLVLHILEKERDFGTLAMVSARAKNLGRDQVVNMDHEKAVNYRAVYRNMLQRAARFVERCIIHKLDPEEKSDPCDQSQQWSWAPKIKCTICRMSVTSSVTLCVRCGHGGHPSCLRDWFEDQTICAIGCGCTCVGLELQDPNRE